jgi:hypothetical protein
MPKDSATRALRVANAIRDAKQHTRRGFLKNARTVARVARAFPDEKIVKFSIPRTTMGYITHGLLASRGMEALQAYERGSLNDIQREALSDISELLQSRREGTGRENTFSTIQWMRAAGKVSIIDPMYQFIDVERGLGAIAHGRPASIKDVQSARHFCATLEQLTQNELNARSRDQDN